MIAFIQKYLIYGLLAVIVMLSVFGTIQYIRVLSQKTTIVKHEATIDDLHKTQAALMGQVADYEIQVKKLKQIQKKVQTISNSTATYQAQIKLLKTKCKLEVGDDKILNAPIINFNNGGLQLSVPK
jgi:cell division protein FtsB